MKKLFRIGAAVLSAAAFVTSTGITTLADGEGTTTTNPSLYMYEDFEKFDISRIAKGGASEGDVYANNVTIMGTNQFYLGTRQASSEVTTVTNSAGSEVLKIATQTPSSDSTGQFGRLYMKFDKDGDNFKNWLADSSSKENFVASYDVTINSVAQPSVGLPLYGGFMVMPLQNHTSFGTLENLDGRGGFQIIFDGDTNTYQWSYRDGNSDGKDSIGDVIKPGPYDLETTTKVVVATNGWTSSGYLKYVYKLYTPDNKVITYNGIRGQGNNNGCYSIDGMIFNALKGMNYSIDNLKAYNLPEGYTFGTTTTDKTNVTRDSSFDIELNGYISDSELEKIVVKQGDTVIPAENYKITATESKTSVGTTVKVKLNEKPGYSQTYSVTLPTGFANEAGVAVAEEKSVSFTTEAGPSFDITLAAATKDGAITSISDAAGKSVSCTVGVTLNQDANSSGTIFVGLYDADDKLVEYGSMDRAFAAHSTATLKTAFDVPANATGYKIKAFACESLSKLDSFATPIEIQ